MVTLTAAQMKIMTEALDVNQQRAVLLSRDHPSSNLLTRIAYDLGEMSRMWHEWCDSGEKQEQELDDIAMALASIHTAVPSATITLTFVDPPIRRQ